MTEVQGGGKSAQVRWLVWGGGGRQTPDRAESQNTKLYREIKKNQETKEEGDQRTDVKWEGRVYEMWISQ